MFQLELSASHVELPATCFIKNSATYRFSPVSIVPTVGVQPPLEVGSPVEVSKEELDGAEG